MIKIGLLSDTHGFFDPALFNFFDDCKEIWHAGDIGDIAITEKINAFKPLKAVYGNIDGQEIRNIYPENQQFLCEGVFVLMTHIGGYPGNYTANIKKALRTYSPGLFISGHSHILKVMPDKDFGLLYINPGAAGKVGFHQIRTAVRFSIFDNQIKDLEIIELGKR